MTVPYFIAQSLSLSPFHHLDVNKHLDYNLSKYLWIFTKLSMCIDVVEIGFGLPVGKFHQFLTDWAHDIGGVLSFHIFVYSFLSWLASYCLF